MQAVDAVEWVTESGYVVEVGSDCLWVETIQRSTCDACRAEKGCGQRLVVKWSSTDEANRRAHGVLRVLLDGRPVSDYAVGDEVRIGVPDHVVVKGSLLVYLTPLFGLIAAALLASVIGLSELMSMVAAFGGFMLGALLVRLHSYYRRNDTRIQPVLIDDVTPLVWG